MESPRGSRKKYCQNSGRRKPDGRNLVGFLFILFPEFRVGWCFLPTFYEGRRFFRFDKRNLRWYLLVIKVDSLGWLIGKPPPQIYSLGRAEGEATTNDTPKTKWI